MLAPSGLRDRGLSPVAGVLASGGPGWSASPTLCPRYPHWAAVRADISVHMPPRSRGTHGQRKHPEQSGRDRRQRKL
eukprot:11658203-Alexandrium_andersonii.AAC.1